MPSLNKRLFFACISLLALPLAAAPRFADRFVFIFGWGLQTDDDVAGISKVLETAGQNHFDGAIVSFGLDTLSKQSPDFFRRLDSVSRCCEKNRLELIPSVFSVGYGSALAYDRNLAEGLPVEDAPFLVQGGQARLAPTNQVQFKNGGFEQFNGNTFNGYNFHDQPGEVSFADTTVRHSGRASLRMENFTANPYGHGRVMQTIRVQPHRCYRMALWVKTEGLQPADALRVEVLAGGRDLAPREFHVPSSTDWRKLTMLFNSLNLDSVSIYAGVWGGKAGKFWLDDWSVEEVGPVNVLHRPGTPVTVRSADGASGLCRGQGLRAAAGSEFKSVAR